MVARQILCLSGWGQKFNSLEFIFNDKVFDPFSVSSLDYSRFGEVDEFFNFLREEQFSAKESSQDENGAKNFHPEILVGWSLGGQLAVRLIEKQILKPKLLILIAPPFQLMKDAKIQAGMALEAFKKFHDNFVDAPDQTLKQFSILTAMNDINAADIARNLDVNDKNFAQLVYWLDELARFSCFNVDFSNMPRTLYFHGAGDMIVHVAQAQYFQQRIKDFHEVIFSGCGHAPQLSDGKRLREMIFEEMKRDNIL